ncbi:hypothetical protein ACFE04_019793 [Oxalis oulophora]
MAKESHSDHFWPKNFFFGKIENGVVYDTTWSFEACLSKFSLGVIYDTTWYFSRGHEMSISVSESVSPLSTTLILTLKYQNCLIFERQTLNADAHLMAAGFEC